MRHCNFLRPNLLGNFLRLDADVPGQYLAPEDEHEQEQELTQYSRSFHPPHESF